MENTTLQQENTPISNAAATAAENLETEIQEQSLTEKELVLMEIEERKKKRKRNVWNAILTLLAIFLIQFGINYNLACVNKDPFMLIPIKNTEIQETYLGFGYTYEITKKTESENRYILNADIKLFGILTLGHLDNVEEEDILNH